jgi:hypothetical protein
MPTQSAWISIFTEEVWQDPVRDKNRRAFPLTRPAKVMAGLIKEGDLIIDYMKGRNCIVGVAQVTAQSQSDAQTRRSPVRYDKNYELGGEVSSIRPSQTARGAQRGTSGFGYPATTLDIQQTQRARQMGEFFPLSPTLGLCGWRNHSSRAPTPRVGRMITFLESAYGPSAHTENELLHPKIEHGNQEGESCRFSLSAFVPT